MPYLCDHARGHSGVAHVHDKDVHRGLGGAHHVLARGHQLHRPLAQLGTLRLVTPIIHRHREGREVRGGGWRREVGLCGYRGTVLCICIVS
jgi:hypothetical protein